MGGIGEPRHFLLQALEYDGHVVDGELHLLVVALVGLRDQLVDLAVGDLRQDAVAFADGQKNRIEHLVDPLNHLTIGAVESCGAASFGQPAFLGGIHKAHDFIQQRVAVMLRGNGNCLPFLVWPLSASCNLRPSLTSVCDIVSFLLSALDHVAISFQCSLVWFLLGSNIGASGQHYINRIPWAG